MIIVIGLNSCAMRNQENSAGSTGAAVIGFYNVENLFDTINDPNILDEDFTPTGKLKWDMDRYREKLGSLSKVIRIMGANGVPEILGLCEIENRKVLEDLCDSLCVGNKKYSIIHKDSPDERGIDVALLYLPSVFQEESSEWIKVVLDDVADPNTRDILYVKGKLLGEKVHLFVNHWPSRGGGQAESEKNRLNAAGELGKRTDQIFASDKNALVIIMGDFNDYPKDKSLSDVLGVGNTANSQLYNMMALADSLGEGSYNYRGDWGTLDQFIISNSLFSGSGLSTSQEDAIIVRKDWMLFKKDDGSVTPNRTYAGDKYTGGISDHLPVTLKIRSK